MSIFRVGLTGGLASGKSTVATRLRESGIPVLDADLIVRDLYRPGEAGARAVADLFGAEYLTPEGEVDRARLSARVFADKEALARLNARVHPLVIAEQKRWFEELERRGEALGVVEATLLVETGGRDRYDFLLAVSAAASVRLERAVKRSGEIHRDELVRRMAAQIPDVERERVADVVLKTDGAKDELLARVDELADRLKAEARRHAASGRTGGLRTEGTGEEGSGSGP